MRGLGAFIAIVLVAAGLVLAGPAGAEDVDECEDAADVSACVYDTSRGDREEACTGNGEGFYKGETGGWIEVGEDPYLQAAAGGEEICSHQNYYSVFRERVFVYGQVCLEDGRWSCASEVDVWFRWDLDGILLSADADPAETSAEAWWMRSGFDCEKGAAIASDAVTSVDEDFQLPCPWEPPEPPSPGWGEVTPDVEG